LRSAVTPSHWAGLAPRIAISLSASMSFLGTGTSQNMYPKESEVSRNAVGRQEGRNPHEHWVSGGSWDFVRRCETVSWRRERL
jgi:hypothetical protein